MAIPVAGVFAAGLASAALPGWSATNWTGDSDSGITNDFVYTAAHCFGNNHPGVTVNGVPFSESFAASGTGWNLGGGISLWNGDDDANVTNRSEDLAEEFVYNGNPRTIQLSGLTSGKRYKATFFSVGWEPAGRSQTFLSGGDSLVVDQDFFGDNNGITISYVYDATNTTQDFTITPSSGTFHLYALANREAATPTWTIPYLSDVTTTSATAHATLKRTNATVTLYWKEGAVNLPFGPTGWAETNGPAPEVSGQVSRAISGLLPDTAYTLVFHATNGAGGGWSPACPFSTALTAAQIPVFTSAVATGTAIALAWEDHASNETAYVLQRSDGGPYTLKAELPPNTTSYLDTGFPASGTWRYRLAATNASNGSVTDFAACETSATITVRILYQSITGDGDSRISTNRNYTHALDFGNQPTTFPVAVVNGVGFGNGSPGAFPDRFGTSQTIGTGSSTLPNGHNGNGHALPGGQLDHLLGDMIYNISNAVITLSGLTPGADYQFRLYHRSYGTGPRAQEIGFETDGTGTNIAGAEHTAIFSEDDAGAPAPGFPSPDQVYALAYDYTPAPGVSNLTVYINKLAANNQNYHLYGLSNEKVGGPPNIVQLRPPDDSLIRVTGNLMMFFDETVRKGAGQIEIRRVGDDSIFETIDVTNANITIDGPVITIDPSGVLEQDTAYYVRIGGGALENVRAEPFAGIADPDTWNLTSSPIFFQPITGDADSGISTYKTYTHAIDFGNSPVATINGVVFGNGNAGAGGFPGPTGSQTVGTGSSNLGNNHGGGFDQYIPFSGQAINDLLHDMVYNADQGVMTLTGLTPGQPYRFRLYNRQWAPGTRSQEIGFETDGVGTDITGAEHTALFYEDDARQPDPDFPTGNQVYALTYDYVLPPGVTSLTVYVNRTGTGTYHLYGLTNEKVRIPLPPGTFFLVR